MEIPMGGPAEAPYALPRVDPGALLFVPMFSESMMLGKHTAPAGSMWEEHATTDLRSPTVLTRSRGGPGHGTLRWTRASKQAGKRLRSQGQHHARVM